MSENMGEESKFFNAKYASRKVKSIKWKPSISVNEKPNIFVSGSWDDEENNVSVWRLNRAIGDPTLIQELPQSHDINDIQYVTRDLLAIATGGGSIKLYQHDQTGNLHWKHSWENYHKLNSGSVPCTALSVNGDQIASVGEDGKILICNPNEYKPLKIIKNDCDCSDFAVVFVTSSQLLTGNMQGHLKLWDLRAKDHLQATLLSPDQVSVNYLSRHPTQQHLVAAAMEDGTLALWDMRSTNQPLVLISAHEGPITEVHFHATASDHLFTCGIDGKVLHWDASTSSRNQIMSSARPKKDNEDFEAKSGLANAWFSEDVKQGFVDGVSLIPVSRLPVNCLDIDSGTLIAGSDNECIYIVNNILYE